MLTTLPLVLLAAFVGLQLSAAAYDFFTMTIPNPIVYGLVAFFVLLGVLNPGEFAWGSHLAAGGLVFTLGLLLFHVNLLGGGDVKLYAASALWVGLGALPLYLVCVALIGLALALVLGLVRPVVPMLLAHLPGGAAARVPQSLCPGGGVPYGIAIAGAAVLLALW